MIAVENAVQLIEQNAARLESETVPIGSAVGRVLAEDIFADTDLPPFDRSQMDGFAVRSVDVRNAPVQLKIVGESAAGRGWHDQLKTGEAVRIMTGAPVPKGADTVQKVELTSEGSLSPASSCQQDHEVTIYESIAAEKNIVRRGAEIKKGDRVLNKGERVSERMIATLAAFGYSKVKVGRRPRVAALTTGSEVVEIDRVPGPDQIRNSNSVMLSALIAAGGGIAEPLDSTSDDLEAIKHAIGRAASDSDVIVTTGGVSVGKYDLTKMALVELGAEIFFDKVKLKPGKPAVFARLGRTLVFGLPGNPVSAAVTFYLFVRRALLMMQGAGEVELRRAWAIAENGFKAARDRDTYLPARLGFAQEGRVVATALKWVGSSDFVGFAGADALAFVPAGKHVEKGGVVDILLL